MVVSGLALIVGLWTVRLAASFLAVRFGGVAPALLGLSSPGSVLTGNCRAISDRGVTVTPTVLPAALFRTRMDENAVAELIETELPDAQATVTTPRDPDDDKHYAVRVVSPAFEGESLVDQHQLVHDALGDHLTRDIHAIELTTLTPEEAE